MAVSEFIFHTLHCWVFEFFLFMIFDFVAKHALQYAQSEEEKSKIWFWESVLIFIFCYVYFKCSHLPILLLLLGVGTYLYTQILHRRTLAVIWEDLKAHWENHLQHEEIVKQLKQHKMVPASAVSQTFPVADINPSQQSLDHTYQYSRQIALSYPPNATVVPGQATPVYSAGYNRNTFGDSAVPGQTSPLYSASQNRNPFGDSAVPGQASPLYSASQNRNPFGDSAVPGQISPLFSASQNRNPFGDSAVPGQTSPLFSASQNRNLFSDSVKGAGAHQSYGSSLNNVAGATYNSHTSHTVPESRYVSYSSGVSVSQPNGTERKSIWNEPSTRRYLHPELNDNQSSKQAELSDRPSILSLPQSFTAKIIDYMRLKPPPSGPAGLWNQGNMCFMNSALQCLARGPHLVENLTAIGSMQLNLTTSEAAFLQSLVELLTKLRRPPEENQERAISIEDFRQACSELNPELVAPTEEAMNQQDVSEFIQFLFTTLQGILNKNQQAIEDASPGGLYVNPNLAHLKMVYRDLTPQTARTLRDQCNQDIVNGLERASVAERILTLSDLDWLSHKNANNNLISNLFQGQYVVASYNNEKVFSVTTGTFENLFLPIVDSKDNGCPVPLESCISQYCNNENLSNVMTDNVHLGFLSRQQSSTLIHKQSETQGLSNTPVTSGAGRQNSQFLPSPIQPPTGSDISSNSWYSSPGVPLRREATNDSGFHDNTFRTSTPLGKGTVSTQQQQQQPGTVQKILFSHLPECLIIQLMRYNVLDGISYKISKSIVVQRDSFDLRKFMFETAVRPGNSEKTNSYIYELYGLCVHLGAESTSNGHYVSYCCHGDKWFRMDDDSVTEVNMDFHLRSAEISQNAYLLFYKQKFL